jgi:Xaa-Pro aminopeptidase
MHRHFDDAGAGDRFIVITSGPGNYDLPSKPPERRAIHSGDMLWIDAGCTVTGYWSDYSRAGVVGGPTPQQQAAHEAICGITRQAVEMVRPGVKCSDIGRFCNEQVARLPFPITSDISGLAARAGHGIGLALTELPHVADYDDTVLGPGMIITIEPGVATEYGTFHVEENVLVTPAGREVLSAAPRELAIL